MKAVTLILSILFTLFYVNSIAQSPEPTYRGTDTSLIKKGDSTFVHVEIESEFPGGAKGWNRYLMDNFNYPKAAVRKRIQGTVVVQFIVDKDGSVINAEVIQSVHPLIDDEALRLIKNSPRWRPAIQDGKKVKSYKKQPVVFQLVEETKKKKE